MKASKTQLIALFVLLLVLLAYIFFTYMLKPLKEEAEEAENQVDISDLVVRNMYIETLSYEKTMEEMKETSSSIRRAAGDFYSNEKQQTWLDTMNTWITESGIQFESIESADFKPVEYYSPEDIEAAMADNADILSDITLEELLILFTVSDSAPTEDSIVLKEMDIEMICSGTYEQVLTFMDSVAANNKHIVARNMELERNFSIEDPDLVRFDVTLGFVNLYNVEYFSSIANVPEYPTNFVMPEDFVNYEYRDTSFLDAFKALLSL